MGLISVLTMRKKLPPGKVRKLYDPNYFRNIPMLWLAGGSLFAMMGFVSTSQAKQSCGTGTDVNVS